MGKQTKKTIFFIEGVKATDEEQAEAEKLNGQVVFRNVRLIDERAPIEPFDFVAGAVPECYKIAAEEQEASASGKPPEPKAKATAPAAPQKAAKPAQGASGGAWKANS